MDITVEQPRMTSPQAGWGDAASAPTGGGTAHRLVVFQPVVGAVAVAALVKAFSGDPAVWLPLPATPVADGWVTRLHAGPVSHAALCGLGQVSRRNGEVWRHISWQPGDRHGHLRALDAALPSFDGGLGILQQRSQLTLALTGTYQPPGGDVGAAADRLVFQRVASATARRWLGDIVKRLTPGAQPLRTKGAANRDQ